MHFLRSTVLAVVLFAVYTYACQGSQPPRRAQKAPTPPGNQGQMQGNQGNMPGGNMAGNMMPGNMMPAPMKTDAEKKMELDKFNADVQAMKAEAEMLNRAGFLAKFMITEDQLKEYEATAMKEGVQDFLDIMAKVAGNP